MAFPSDKSAQIARWSDIQAILDALTGVTGGGDRVQLTQYNNASNYALDVRNLDTTNSYGLRVRDAADAVIATFAKNAIALGANAANDSLTLNTNISGKVYIGDSANGKMTTGLTINQAAADDQILAVKSSDVNHGMTDITETDTYGYLSKAHATGGGLTVDGLTDTDGDAGKALLLIGTLGEAADTTKTTAGLGVIELHARVKSGTTVAAVGADGNLVSITNNGTTRYLFDVEGTLHSIGASYTDSVGNGLWFINDTANTGMTVGLTINQGGADNEILALKSSDVAHGVTDLAETDTFGLLKKQHTAGGVEIDGLHSGATSICGIRLLSVTENEPETGKTTAYRGSIRLTAAVKSGTSIAAVGADGNLVSIESSGLTRFLFDAEGSAHGDVEWVAFDGYDDLALIASLEGQMAGDGIKAEFGEWMRYNRDALQAARVVNFYDEGPRAMVNFTRLSMLLCGAIRQLGRRLELAEQRLQALPAAH